MRQQASRPILAIFVRHKKLRKGDGANGGLPEVLAPAFAAFQHGGTQSVKTRMSQSGTFLAFFLQIWGMENYGIDIGGTTSYE